MDVLSVRNSTLHDCCLLKDHLRKEHVKEIWEFERRTPEQSLVLSYILSVESFTVLINGELPCFMFGVVPDPDGNGLAWALGSDALDRVYIQFIKRTKYYAQHLLTHFSMIYNYVPADYKAGVNWVKYFGARIYDKQPLGHNGELYHRWELRR